MDRETVEIQVARLLLRLVEPAVEELRRIAEGPEPPPRAGDAAERLIEALRAVLLPAVVVTDRRPRASRRGAATPLPGQSLARQGREPAGAERPAKAPPTRKPNGAEHRKRGKSMVHDGREYPSIAALAAHLGTSSRVIRLRIDRGLPLDSVIPRGRRRESAGVEPPPEVH